MEAKKIEVMFEFLVFGILIGITEDILAIKLVTGRPITLKGIGIVIIIAIPFAVIGEVIADRIDFVSLYQKITKKKVKSSEDNKQ